MRRLFVSGVLIAVTSAGCLRSTGGKAGEALLIGGAGAGFMYGVACADYGDGQHRCESTEAAVGGFAIIGALLGGLVLAIYSESHYKPPAIEEPPMPATVNAGAAPALFEPVEPRDPQVHAMTVAAHRAAWQGDCSALPALAQRVNAIDPVYYAQVFYPDPPIQRCMQAR
jgi:hypothetical protein